MSANNCLSLESLHFTQIQKDKWDMCHLMNTYQNSDTLARQYSSSWCTHSTLWLNNFHIFKAEVWTQAHIATFFLKYSIVNCDIRLVSSKRRIRRIVFLFSYVLDQHMQYRPSSETDNISRRNFKRNIFWWHEGIKFPSLRRKSWEGLEWILNNCYQRMI